MKKCPFWYSLTTKIGYCLDALSEVFQGLHTIYKVIYAEAFYINILKFI